MPAAAKILMYGSTWLMKDAVASLHSFHGRAQQPLPAPLCQADERPNERCLQETSALDKFPVNLMLPSHTGHDRPLTFLPFFCFAIPLALLLLLLAGPGPDAEAGAGNPSPSAEGKAPDCAPLLLELGFMP